MGIYPFGCLQFFHANKFLSLYLKCVKTWFNRDDLWRILEMTIQTVPNPDMVMQQNLLSRLSKQACM